MVSTQAVISSASPTRTPANEPLSVQQKQQCDTKESLYQIPVQRKLSVGAADDPLEKEADDMADKVMRMPNPEPISFSMSKNVIDRKCSECEKEEELQRKESNGETISDKVMRKPSPEPISFSTSKTVINRKCSECEKEEELQRKESNGETVSSAPSIVQDVLSSPGRSLDTDTRSFMEPRFNYDFSDVKIHDNDLAAKSADSINALAYTSGNNVVFNSGEYNTNSFSGKRLLAHELTHVVQQNGPGIQRQEAATPVTASKDNEAGKFIVVDNTAPAAGQMRKSDFLERLNVEVCATVDQALQGSMFSSDNCPYIRAAFARYQNSTPVQLEQVIERYEPSTRMAQSAEDLIQLMKIRVSAAATRWLQTGDLSDLPEEIRSQIPSGLGLVSGIFSTIRSGIGSIFLKANTGTAKVSQSPAVVMRSLGTGSPIDGNTRSKMESAFGTSFADVEVHTDSNASALSSNMNARAFTVGNHIAFSNGEHQPGSLIGDALIAHELAHVMQQGNSLSKKATSSVDQNNYDSLEEDADNSAIHAITSMWGDTKRLSKNLFQQAIPRLKSGLKLQSCPSRTPPPISTTHGIDQRAGNASVPDANLGREIGYELDPSSRPAPVAPPPPVAPGAPAPPPPPPPRIPWDGAAGAANRVAARAAMQTELFRAYDAYLTFKRPATVAALAQHHVPFATPAAVAAQPASTGVVDIANQARQVLETRYSISMNAGSNSAIQSTNRATRTVTPGPGQNLFDSSSEADRSTLVGDADLAHGVAFWLFANDNPGTAGAAGTRRFATEILAAHHYSVDDDPGSRFRWDVANAYAAASTIAPLVPNNRRALIEYRMTDWSERGDRGITLQSGFTPGGNPNRSELMERWQIFNTATHESLHLRAHPAFVAAQQGRDTMSEGFTEMFTISTLNTDILPRVRSRSAEPLRHIVEGALSTPAPDNTIITNRASPLQYVPHRDAAERIRDGGTPLGGGPAHAGIGEAGVRAAFFQGHVEYIGLDPIGSQLGGLRAAGTTPLIRIPVGIRDLNDLARRSGVPRATIERDNPGITDVLPLAAVLTGCREHWVVSGEERVNIAAQNGISEADLVRANPDIPVNNTTNAWPTLTGGQKILIPVH
ncbi:MAG TPA: DUF4157 domain-containing protein [Chitinophagaceae bacterium]|jgi:hypothetical protein|nr:DUF4157 domain-containing protein [Chitinophagaceae bacterium]